jgi:hypothetical protein
MGAGQQNRQGYPVLVMGKPTAAPPRISAQLLPKLVNNPMPRQRLGDSQTAVEVLLDLVDNARDQYS